MTRYQEQLRKKVNEKSHIIMENKLYFHILSNSLTEEVVPKIYGIISSSKAFDECYNIENDDHWQWINNKLLKEEKLVIKEISGSGGKNVFIIESSNDGINIVGNYDNNDLRNALSHGEFIVTEYVSQADYANDIYPNTANSIRVMTFWDYEKQKPYVAGAVHRFGTNCSTPVDNFGAGGLSVGIDLSTGELQQGATKPTGLTMNWHSFHPDTGEQISGVKVPNWDSICEDVCELATKFSEVKMVGWDILVTDSGFVILEGNAYDPDFKMIQIHRPLLLDERNRKFLSRHNVI